MKKRITLILMAFALSSLNVSLSAQIQNTDSYREAMQHLSSGEYDKAVESLTSQISGENSAAAMVEIGKIRQKQAEYEAGLSLSHFLEAANMLDAGLEGGGSTGPQTSKLIYDLGVIYSEHIKDYPRAIDMFTNIVNNYPTFMNMDRVYYNLATCNEAIANFDEAAQYYSTIVSDYSYSTYYGQAKEKMQKLAPKSSSSEIAIELQENIAYEASEETSAQANVELGDMQMDAGEYKAAAAAYRNALKDAKTPEDAVIVYRKLVNVLEEKEKDYAGATAAIEEMMQKYPNAAGTDDLVYRLGRMYETDMDNMKKSVDSSGRVRYRKSRENMEKAVDYYDKVTQKSPDSDTAADAYLRKAEIYYSELKDYGKARAAYSEFLKNFPDHSEAENAREKLNYLEGY